MSAFLVAGALALAACGGSSSSSEGAAPTTAAAGPADAGGGLVDVPGFAPTTERTVVEVPVSREPGSGVGRVAGDLQVEQTDEGVEAELAGDVLFDTGSATLRPDATYLFEAVVEAAAEYPGVGIRLTGHTDDVGDDASNQRLSERRAASAAAALVALAPSLQPRIEVAGRGESEPTAPNTTPEGRQANRRVSVLFVGARL